MWETIFVDGVKYIVKKNIKINDVLLKIYIKSAKKAKKDMMHIYDIKIYFDQKLFKEKIQNLFIITKFHSLNEKDRQEIFVNTLINNGIVMFEAKDRYLNEEEIINYTKLFYKFIQNKVKIEIINNEYGFREYNKIQLDTIREEIEELKNDKRVLENIINEREYYKKEFTKAQQEYNRLLLEHEKLKKLVHKNEELDNLLQQSISIGITDKIKYDLELAFEWYSHEAYRNALNILKKYNDILKDNHIFNYFYANSLYKEKEYDKAIQIYETRIFTNGQLNKYTDKMKKYLYFYYGDSLLNTKRYAEAFQQFKNAKDIDENFIEAIFNMGLSKFNQSIIIRQDGFAFIEEYIREAKEYFYIVKNKKKYLEQCCFNLAIIERMLGNLNQAIEFFILSSNLLEDISLRIQCYTELIESYLLRNDDENAKRYIDKVERILEDANDFELSKVHKWHLCHYYQTRGTYYISIDYNKCLESYYMAYKIIPNEQTKENYEFHLNNRQSSDILEIGKYSIIRSAKIN
ncbi:hypothetical protein [Caloranaerobacter ferrireducens]|uniref:hypothetical protein n=1 Tax=Caloranaerobacter ferrireducens TaxID=1323370 RepID=UPI00084CFA95|nr:hypothetical protein [Caloranaerobacter ferrireducens]